MSWERRIVQILMAGGALVAGGCTSDASGIPCGNANPDPCICGRPAQSASAKALCDEQTACQAQGGIFDPSTCVNCASDGGVVGPHCTLPSEGGAADGSGDGGAGG